MTHLWNEDESYPREDVLTKDFTADAIVLPVAHPEWFRPGDIVRVGEDDLYDSGEVNEWGYPIMRARNESVLVTAAPSMLIAREYGVNGAQAKPKGERVTILGSVARKVVF